MVRVRLVQQGQLVNCKADVLHRERNDAAGGECPALQRWRGGASNSARAYQRLQLQDGQAVDGMPIWEHDRCGGARLVECRDDVAVRNQFLHLKGVHLPKAGGACRQDQDRIARWANGHRRGHHRVAGDVPELPEEEARLAVDARKGRHHGVGLLHVRSTGRRRAHVGGIPDLHHHFTARVRVCTEDVRA